MMEELQRASYNAWYSDNVQAKDIQYRPLLARIGTFLNDYRFRMTAYPIYALTNQAITEQTGIGGTYERLESASSPEIVSAQNEILGQPSFIEQHAKGVWSTFDRLITIPEIEKSFYSLLTRYKDGLKKTHYPDYDSHPLSWYFDPELFTNSFRFARTREKAMALCSLYSLSLAEPEFEEPIHEFFTEFIRAGKQVKDLIRMRAYYPQGQLDKTITKIQKTKAADAQLVMQRTHMDVTPSRIAELELIAHSMGLSNPFPGIEIPRSAEHPIIQEESQGKALALSDIPNNTTGEKIMNEWVEATNTEGTWSRIFTAVLVTSLANLKDKPVPLEIQLLLRDLFGYLSYSRYEYKRT